MKEVKLNIEGMHCTGCSTRLEKVLNNVDGVEDAKVSLEEKKADIKYDETQVSEKELIEAVKDAGFKAN
jgi:copper chaperone CopZ